MAPPDDRRPRPSEGPLPVRTVGNIILYIKTIQDELQQMISRNQKILDAAKARRGGNNGEGGGLMDGDGAGISNPLNSQFPPPPGGD